MKLVSGSILSSDTLIRVVFFMLLISINSATANNLDQQPAYTESDELIVLALFDPKKALFDSLKAAGKSYTYIARQLKSKFNMSATAIAQLMKSAGVSNKNIIKAVKSASSASAGTAANIAKNVFNITNKGTIAKLLKDSGYSLIKIAKALKNNLGVSTNNIIKILKNRLNQSNAQVAAAMNSFLNSPTKVIKAFRQGLNASVTVSAGLLKTSFGYGKSKASQLAVIMKNAGYTTQQQVNSLAKFMNDNLDMTRAAAKTALAAAYGLGVLIEDALIYAYGVVASARVAVGNVLTDGYIVGQAKNCRISKSVKDDNLQHARKFNHFIITSAYRDVNHYLAMQASNMTYFKHFETSIRTIGNRTIIGRPKTEAQYRCAAEAKYKSWGFNNVWFVNSAGGNAILASKNDMLLIAIRGTEDPSGSDHGPLEGIEGILDVATTIVGSASIPFILPTMKGLKAGNMHVGYAALMTKFVPALMDALKKMGVNPKSNKPIYVTGHSLGASTATLAAFSLKLLKYNMDAAYVYAPPKVGDHTLNKSIQNTIKLYVTENYRDPVPTIPHVANALKVIQGKAPFLPVMGAAQKSIYFQRSRHVARVYDKSKGYFQREADIHGDQGVPPTRPPLLLLGGGNVMSHEWKFHSGNYYTAYAYNQMVVANQQLGNEENLKPEFSTNDKMCMTRSNGSTYETKNITQALLMNQVYARIANQCGSNLQTAWSGIKSGKQAVLNKIAFVGDAAAGAGNTAANAANRATQGARNNAATQTAAARAAAARAAAAARRTTSSAAQSAKNTATAQAAAARAAAARAAAAARRTASSATQSTRNTAASQTAAARAAAARAAAAARRTASVATQSSRNTTAAQATRRITTASTTQPKTTSTTTGPDIAVTLKAPARARTRAALIYQVLVINKDRVRNSGALTLRSRIPTGTVYTPDPRDGWTMNKGTVSRTIRSLKAGGTLSYRLKVLPMKPGPMTTSMTVNSQSRLRDPNLRNNTSTAVTVVQ